MVPREPLEVMPAAAEGVGGGLVPIVGGRRSEGQLRAF